MMSFVNYYYSTSIWQIAIFVRKILQGEENKGVELTGGQRKCWRAGGRRREVNSRQSRQGRDLRFKVEGKSRTFLEAIQFFWRARAASRRGRGSQKAARSQLLVLCCKLLVLWDGRKMLNTEFAESTEDTERKATAETDSKYLRDGTLVSLF